MTLPVCCTLADLCHNAGETGAETCCRVSLLVDVAWPQLRSHQLQPDTMFSSMFLQLF